MSVRPREAVNEASRFSLRSILGGGGGNGGGGGGEAVLPTAVSQEQEFSLEPQPRAQGHFQPPKLQFHINAPVATAGAPLLPLPTSQTQSTNGLKFTLPAMKGSSAAAGAHGQTEAMRAPMSDAGGARILKAGFLTGGAARSSDPEIMRLNAVVDDLNTKLKKTGERLAATEQSVARGNKALATERSMAQARSVALMGELKNAQTREAAVRAEMASMPKVSDFDQQRFDMQAQGAVELQAKYEDEVARTRQLESVVAAIELKHTGLHETHANIAAELETARLKLEDANARVEAAAEAESAIHALQAKLEEAERERESAVAEAAGEAGASMQCLRVQLEKAESEKTAALAEAEAARAIALAAATKGSDVQAPLADATLPEAEELKEPEVPPETLTATNADEANADEANEADEAENGEPNMTIFSFDDDLPGQKEDTNAPLAFSEETVVEVPVDQGDAHTEKIAMLEQELAAKLESFEAEKDKLKLSIAEADTIIKSTDLAAVMARQERDFYKEKFEKAQKACITGVSNDDAFVQQEYKDEFQIYYGMYLSAKAATQTLVDAGSDATTEQFKDAAQKAMYAKRAHESIINGTDRDEPRIMCGWELENGDICDEPPTGEFGDDEGSDVEIDELRAEMETNLNIDNFKLGVSTMADFDCDVDLNAILTADTAATATDETAEAVVMENTSEAISKKLRTDAYVTAVSDDISKRLKGQQKAWKLGIKIAM